MGEDARKDWEESRFCFTVSAGDTEQKVAIVPWPKPEYAAPPADVKRAKQGPAAKGRREPPPKRK
jgi:hypothetical protein